MFTAGAFSQGAYTKNSDDRTYWTPDGGEGSAEPVHTRGGIKEVAADTNARLYGSVADVETLISIWAAITDAEYDIDLNGLGNSYSGISFASVTSMEDVAAVFNSTMQSEPAFCEWDGENLILSTDSVGAGALISFMTDASGGGTYVGALAGCESTSEGAFIRNGIDAGVGLTWVKLKESRKGLIVSADIEATTFITDQGDAVADEGLPLDANRPAVSYEGFSGDVNGIVSAGTATIGVKFQD